VRNWRSIPTYCQLQNHVTQKNKDKNKKKSGPDKL